MYLEPCTPEQLKIIYTEINIDEESLDEHVRTLMEWIETQPELPKIKSKCPHENYHKLSVLRLDVD